MATKELTIDPELRDFLPNHDDDALLKKQLEEEGCRDPIVTWANHEDTVIDGNRRYRLCTELGIPFKTIALSFPDKASVMEWMWANQGNRRNMTPQDLKLARAKLYEKKKGVPGAKEGNENAEKNKGAKIAPLNSPAKTAEKVAETTGVSPRTIHNDVKFKEALDKVAPLVRDKIDGKAVKASTAELERLAELPAPQQRDAVDAVKSGAEKTLGSAIGKLAPKATPAASIVLDAIKRPIPKHLTEKHATAALIQSAATKLDAVKHALEDLKEAEGAEFLQFSPVLEALKDVKKQISDSRYWSECPRCQGKVKAKCDRCDGHGYLPFSRKGQLSAEDKAYLGVE